MATWPSYDAGTARLNIEPHFGNLFQQIESRVNAYNAPNVEVGVELHDFAAFEANVESRVRALTAPDVKVKVKLDADNLQQQLENEIAAATQSLTIPVKLDLTDAYERINTFRAYAGRPISTRLDLDTAGAQTQLAALQVILGQLNTSFGSLSGLNVGNLGGGGSGGGAGVGAARRRATDEMRGGMIERIQLRVELDRASVQQAERDLAQATARLEQARERATDSSQRSNLAQRRLADTQRQNTRATEELSQAQQNLADLQSSGTASAEDLQNAQQRVAAAHDRAERSTTSLQAATQAAARAQRDATARSQESNRALGDQADAHRRLDEAQENQGRTSRLVRAGLEGLAETAMNGATSLVGMVNPAGLATTALMGLAAVSLIPLIGQIIQAAGVISLLPAMGAAAAATFGTVMLGVSGIGDAITAGADAAEEAGDEQEAYAKKVEQAQRGVADAQKDAAKTAEQGAESIRRAEKNVQSAQKDSVRAQEDLTRARKDAQEQIEDLNLALRGSALDEESAVLAVERARRRLQSGDFTGPDADLDRRDADLSYRQSIQRLAEVRERNNDLRQETEAATRAGVEGSEQVVEAKERVADADAKLIEAQQAVGKAQADAAEANADAQQRITDAQSALNEALSEGSTKADAYEKAMAKLSPKAQEFVEAIGGMQGALEDLKFTVQDELFDGMATSIEQLGDTYLPILTDGLGGLADVLNGRLRAAMDWLMDPGQTSAIETILQNTEDALGPLMDGLGNLGKIMLDLAEVGSEFLPGLMQDFDDATTGWAEKIGAAAEDGGGLKEWMAEALRTFGQLWDIVVNLKDIATGIFSGSDEVGESWLTNIENATAEWAKFFQTPEGQDEVKSFFQDVKDIVDSIVTALQIGAGLMGTFRPAGGSDRGEVDTDGNGIPDTPGALVPEQLEPGEAREAGAVRQAWDAADNSDSWIGKTARGFNSFFGYNNETDSYDGGMWNPNNEGTVGHWFGNIGNRTGNWFNEQTAEIGEMFTGPMTIGGKPVSEIWADAQAGWESFSASVGDKAQGVQDWLGGVKDRAVEIGSNVLSSIGTTAKDAWNGLVDDVKGGWNDHIAPAWNTLQTEGLGGLADSFLEKVTNGAVTSWGDLPSAIGDGVGKIVDEHFPGLSEGIGKVKDFFTDLRTSVSQTWSDLLADLAGGVNKMIDLINWGVGGLWSKVDGFLGNKLPDWQDVPHVSWGSAAGGGAVPGMESGGFVPLEPGTQWGKDGVLRVLAPGEFVFSEPAVRAAGVDNLTAFNNAARGGGTPSAEGMFAMESGGRVTRDDPAWEMLKRGHDFAKSQAGKPYQWAGPTGVDTSFDCTGFMASIAAAILGQNVWQRYFYTGSFRGGQPGPMGFQPGLGAGFSIGVFDNPGGDGGGHAAGSLTGAEGLPDVNVESSGGAGVQYGGGARGASNSMFPWQFHLPIVDGAFVDPGPGGGSLGGPTPQEQGSLVGRFIDKLIAPMREKLVDSVGEPPPEWKTIPPAIFDGVLGPLKEFAVEKASVIDVIAEGVRDLKDAIAEPVANAWDFVFNRDTGGNLPPGLNLVLNKTGEDEYVLNPEAFKAVQGLVDLLRTGAPLLATAVGGPQAGAAAGAAANAADYAVDEYGSRVFQTQEDGTLSDADTLANMAPEARKTFEENGQGAPGGDGFNWEQALAETTGITIDHRPVEERMASWAETYGNKWANYGRETAGELIDDALSPLGFGGIRGVSVGQIVTQDVPEAMTRLARLADMAARGYTRTMGR